MVASQVVPKKPLGHEHVQSARFIVPPLRHLLKPHIQIELSQSCGQYFSTVVKRHNDFVKLPHSGACLVQSAY